MGRRGSRNQVWAKVMTSLLAWPRDRFSLNETLRERMREASRPSVNAAALTFENKSISWTNEGAIQATQSFNWVEGGRFSVQMCLMWICLVPEAARWAMKVCWLWTVPYFVCLLSSHSWAWVSRSPDFNTWKGEKSVLVAQSCPTLCNPMDCSPPGSSVHGIFQARILEWVAIRFSRESSQPRDRSPVSRIVGRSFTAWATKEVGRGSGVNLLLLPFSAA